MTYDAKEKSQTGGAPVELYKLTVGAVAFYYTSADTNVTYLGNLYTKVTIQRGDFDQTGAEKERGALEVRLPRTNPVVTYFTGYLPEPPMGITVFRNHRGDSEFKARFTGTVASCRVEGAEAVLTCLPLDEAFRDEIPRDTYGPQCQLALYSARCTVGRASFKVTGLVTVIAGLTIQSSAFAAKPDGWFNNGYAQRASGERRWIVNHVGATLTLLSPFIGLAVNESLDAYAGCDRTEAVCASKFSNLDNHFGFARVPTKNPYNVGLT